jgi:hypothetical protein
MTSRFAAVYQVGNSDELGAPGFWNERFSDIDRRLAAIEAYQRSAAAAPSVIVDRGVARIDDTLQPLIDSKVSAVSDLTSSVSSLQGQVLSAQNSLTTQLASVISTAQNQIAFLQSLGTVDGGAF